MRVMAVQFVDYGRLYYLDPGAEDYAVGDRVLVPSAEGPEVAVCVWPPTEVEWSDGPLPECAGLADAAALLRDEENRVLRSQLWAAAEAIIAQHELPMKIVGLDVQDRRPDCDRLTAIYYTAPQRVDFRALLGDLAHGLSSRIDLRQVGSRDAAALIGGCGSCGRELCCITMGLPSEPVPSRALRVQDLSPNPMQIAGACGRMMCCIGYEQQRYLEFLRDAPATGSEFQGGRVVALLPGSEEVVVEVAGERVRCPLRDDG